jgi:tRNA dimethylallyltransferase
VVFVVGGTGFYFQAIEKGMYPIGAADPVTIQEVENEVQESPEKLHQELRDKDPEAAAKISINDHYRLARAIEILRTHGKPPSQIRKEFEESRAPFPYPLLKIGIRAPKEELLPRVAVRTQKMLKLGLLEEVQSLLDRGLSQWAPLQSVGYKEAIDYLKGRLTSEEELKNLIVQNTMRLAKKQRTWFQRDAEILWISRSEKELGLQRIQAFLNP